jgi:hypothetical protein
MKGTRRRVWTNLHRALALGAMLWAGGCGQTGTTVSGETHFLRPCERDADCGSELSCLCGVCSMACEDGEQCSTFGPSVTCVSRASHTCRVTSATCDASCSTDADCGALPGELICDGGVCRVASKPPSAPMGVEEAPAGGDTPCANGCRQNECSHQGSCSSESNCTRAGCGTSAIDDQGCYRSLCTADGSCEATERCTLVERQLASGCAERDDICECADAQRDVVKVCSPMALSGPRGAVQRLVIIEEVTGRQHLWELFPSGRVRITGDDVEEALETTLSEEDRASFVQLLEGPDVRRDIFDPLSCGGAADDYRVDMYLHLDTELGTQDVTRCVALSTPFMQLMAIARRY